MADIDKQIEAAYDYRGHVTIHLKNGGTVEGFIYNREFFNPRLPEDLFIEVFLKGSGEQRRYRISEIRSVDLTGKDLAATNPYR